MSESNAPSLSIRPYALEDIPGQLEAVRASLADLMPWMPWCHANYSLEDSRAWIELQRESFPAGKEYAFAVLDARGQLIGACGLNRFDLPNRVANLGYWIRSSERGQGYAVQAAKKVSEWAFSQTPFCRLEILAAQDNRASQRVAEKVGARWEGLLRSRLVLHEKRHDAVIYSLIRPGA